MRQILFLCLNLLALTPAIACGAEAFKVPGMNSIYGVDDREFISKYSNKKMRELSRSVALIVSSDIVEVGLFQTKIKATTLADFAEVCSDEKFSNSRSLSGCTGFLAASDILISAGHCFESVEDCENKKIIFDVDEKKQTSEGYKVISSKVYSCKEILFQKREDNLDYAVIKLDRTPTDRSFLRLNTNKKIDLKTSVFMIGHPMGLPLTLSRKAVVTNILDEEIFGARLDSFTGNSGSPVFNSKTFEVEGILINGQTDLFKDPSRQCYRNTTYGDFGAEGVFRATQLPAFSK